MTYIILNSAIWLTTKLSRGRLITTDEDEKEYWTPKMAGPAPWFVRFFRKMAANEDNETQKNFQVLHETLEPQKIGRDL